jgi:hypothetical protein
MRLDFHGVRHLNSAAAPTHNSREKKKEKKKREADHLAAGGRLSRFLKKNSFETEWLSAEAGMLVNYFFQNPQGLTLTSALPRPTFG